MPKRLTWPYLDISLPTVTQYGADSGGPGRISQGVKLNATPTGFLCPNGPQYGARALSSLDAVAYQYPDEATIFTVNTAGCDHLARKIFCVQEEMPSADDYQPDQAVRLARAALILRLHLGNDKLVFRHPDMTEVSDPDGEASVTDTFDEHVMYTFLVVFGYYT